MKYPTGALTVVDDEPPIWVGSEIRWVKNPTAQCWATGWISFNIWLREDVPVCCPEFGNFEETVGLCPKHYEEIIGGHH